MSIIARIERLANKLSPQVFTGSYRSRIKLCGSLLIVLLACPLMSQAEQLPAPKDATALIVKGDMQNTNIDGEAHFDLEMLRNLPRTEIETMTPWDEGLQSFAGVLVDDLLKTIAAGSQNFTAIGIDDYKFDVTDIAFENYPVIIAYEHNGNPISVRKLGPLRIIFPFTDYPELLSQKNEASAVWQLVEMRLL